ncbi:MAG: hypothetical protein AABZ39_12305 [Spirochaetota bacterium]
MSGLNTGMNSRERLRRLFYHEEMDRPAVIIRWWGFRDDPSLDDLYRLMTERADWVEPWHASSLVHNVPCSSCSDTEASENNYTLKTAADAERYLEMPMPEVGGNVSEYFRLRKMVGDRGIVLANIGSNPGGTVAAYFGSEQFALQSVLNRDMLHRLMQRELAIKLRLVDFLIEQGVGPYFNCSGQEYITPPLHGRDDFFDFNVRYDKPISDRIHDSGGRLSVHCHGSVKSVIDGFHALGADVFHCFEAPPMGDITPSEAKVALKGRVALEGNIQISDMYEKSPNDIRVQTEALIRDCFDDHKGLAVSPTASPFMAGKGGVCYPQYLAMVETVINYNRKQAGYNAYTAQQR